MRVAAMFVVCLALSFSFQGTKQQAPAHKEHNAAAQGPPPPQPGTQNHECPNRYQDKTKDAILGMTSDWWMVIITAVAALIALCGLRALIVQANAAKDAADAAKQSADALINIERPWLVLYRAERAQQGVRDSDGIQRDRLAVRWRVKNIGKTPAVMGPFRGGLEIVKDPSADLPSEPHYSQPHAVSDEIHLLAAGEESPVITTLMNRAYEGETEWRALTRGELWLVLFGSVCYGDPLKNPHETRFCYSCVFDQPNGFAKMCGPLEYNRMT